MIRTQIQLTEGQSQHLKEAASAQNVSVAELIRRSIDSYLQSQIEPSREERERKALALIGIGSSGLDDLSINHDEYLFEEQGFAVLSAN